MRLIDADALKPTDFEIVMCDNYKDLAKTLIDKIENAPTIDAVPVVRCRECQWRDNTYWCAKAAGYVGSDCFCSWGKK